MINTKLQSIIDTKSAIGNAIVNKGGTITSETPFFNYAAQIDGISTGTPQTIFQASDGSKWALTNAVNLVNDAGNVTHDFNYWQPANNSTSDPILNVGTVGANISGNIQLVPVNQVNIAQFENIVINDTTGAKYVGYNGYDSQTNPTPTGNTTFNRWLLNNSASGTVLFANTVITNDGTFNGPNLIINEASMPFVNNTANYGGTIQTLSTNNGFIYAGGDTNQTVQKFYEDNLAFVGNTANYGGSIRGITTNNGFIYVGGTTNRTVQKFYESNLAFVGNTATYGNGSILSVIVNNGYIYVGGFDNGAAFTGTIRKYHESNLAFDSNSTTTNGVIQQIVASNNNLYIAGGFDINSVLVYHESNLVFINSTGNYGDRVISTVVNNGYIYAGGWGTNTIKRYYDSNFAFLDNSAAYGSFIEKIVLDNGFIYAGGRGNATANRDIKKYHESNLAFVGNTVNYGGNIFNGLIINNNALYVGGDTNNTVKKYQAAEISYENIPIFSITSLKEE
jgi:hypothetical protein